MKGQILSTGRALSDRFGAMTLILLVLALQLLNLGLWAWAIWGW